MDAEAADILARMMAVYANCRSYRDTGVVTRIFYAGLGKRTWLRPFSTAFVRPNRFRFEFRDNFAGMVSKWNQYAIWLENGEARTWWTIRPEDRGPLPLRLALAAAVGASGVSSILVPSMLMPVELNWPTWDKVDEVSFGPEADVGGRRCIVLTTTDPIGRTLYVDAGSMLLRRVERQDRDLGLDASREPPPLPESVNARISPVLHEKIWEDRQRNAHPTMARSTMDYSPEIDVDIAPEELAFTPPS